MIDQENIIPSKYTEYLESVPKEKIDTIANRILNKSGVGRGIVKWTKKGVKPIPMKCEDLGMIVLPKSEAEKLIEKL